MKKSSRRKDTREKPASSNLSSSVVATLKEEIVHWHYPPEHRLTEDGLCKRFGMSRSPIREALRVLTSYGFIRKLPNRSYVVKQYTTEEIEELYEVRQALELYTVERLAGKDTPLQHQADLDDLHHTWSELLKEPSKKSEEFAILDTLFHDTLARALGNTFLLRSLRTINERLTLFRKPGTSRENMPPTSGDSESDHREGYIGGARGHAGEHRSGAESHPKHHQGCVGSFVSQEEITETAVHQTRNGFGCAHEA
jgi:DNA-binding GntR family transcriptional regulator